MASEKYIAAVSLALFIMFVGEIISIFNFMINNAEFYRIEPEPKIFQFVSIGVAPAVIMTAISYFLTKRYGSKPVGSMIFAGGAILLVGMIVSFTMVDDIDEKYQTTSVLLVSPVFMIVSIPVMITGASLLKIKKKKHKKEYF